MQSEIPEGWKNMKVNDLFYLERQNILPNLHPESSFVHFSIPAYDEKKEPQISLGKEIESNKYRIRHDSILLSKLNPRIKRLWLARTSEKYSKYRAMVCSTEFIPLVPKKELDLLFYYYYMSLDVFYDLVKRNAEGTTNSRQRMKPEEILGFDVLEPPINEQQKIATILQSLDDVITKTKELIEKHKKMKQGLMQDLLIGLSSNWMIVSLSNVTAFISRGKSPEYADNSENFIINQACIYWDDFKFENLKRVSPSFWSKLPAEYITKEGDIFINSTGTGTIGRVQFLDFEKRFTWDSHVTVVRTTERVVPRLLFYILQTPPVQTQIDIHCITGSTNQIELSRERLKEIKIRIPEETEEQETIAERIHSVERKIKSEQLYLDKLIKMKTGMMQDLLTGRVRVAA